MNIGKLGHADALKRLGMSATIFSLGLMASAPAWAQSQELIDAAMAEGKVVWYTTMLVDPAVRPMVAAFEAKYPGITVEFARANSTDTSLKIINEANAGRPQADVFDGSTTYRPLLPAGLIEPYVPEGAVNLLDTQKHEDGYLHAIYLTFLTLAVNTDIVPEAEWPTSYEDLLDPKWKGKMVWTVEPEPDAAPGFIGNILQTMGEEAGLAYLDQLVEQDVTNVVASPRAVIDQVILGEYPLTLTAFNHHAVTSAAQGAPIKWLPVSPIVGNASLIGLVKDGPNPNAGKLLIEFILSDEGQQVLRGANYVPASQAVEPVDPNMRPAPGSGTEVMMMTPDVLEANIDRWIAVMNEKFR